MTLATQKCNVFTFDPAGIRIHFPQPGTMEFKQGGNELVFVRE